MSIQRIIANNAVIVIPASQVGPDTVIEAVRTIYEQRRMEQDSKRTHELYRH